MRPAGGCSFPWLVGGTLVAGLGWSSVIGSRPETRQVGFRTEETPTTPSAPSDPSTDSR